LAGTSFYKKSPSKNMVTAERSRFYNTLENFAKTSAFTLIFLHIFAAADKTRPPSFRGPQVPDALLSRGHYRLFFTTNPMDNKNLFSGESNFPNTRQYKPHEVFSEHNPLPVNLRIHPSRLIHFLIYTYQYKYLKIVFQ
jgi:hypothetical protein